MGVAVHAYVPAVLLSAPAASFSLQLALIQANMPPPPRPAIGFSVPPGHALVNVAKAVASANRREGEEEPEPQKNSGSGSDAQNRFRKEREAELELMRQASRLMQAPDSKDIKTMSEDSEVEGTKEGKSVKGGTSSEDDESEGSQKSDEGPPDASDSGQSGNNSNEQSSDESTDTENGATEGDKLQPRNDNTGSEDEDTHTEKHREHSSSANEPSNLERSDGDISPKDGVQRQDTRGSGHGQVVEDSKRSVSQHDDTTTHQGHLRGSGSPHDTAKHTSNSVIKNQEMVDDLSNV